MSSYSKAREALVFALKTYGVEPRRYVFATLDEMGLMLAERKHQWTPAERSLYERARHKDKSAAEMV